MKSLRTLSLAAVAAGALVLTAGAATAQTQPSREEDVISAIFGALFGDRQASGGTVDAQWAAGRRPLSDQRARFDARVDADVRSGALSSSTGARLRSDYADLVALESRYGADRRYSAEERADLTARYQALIQTLDDGGYGYDDDYGQGSQAYVVAQGRGRFDARVDEQVRLRRLNRNQANRLKSDYLALVQIEAGYHRDGRLMANERQDLETRLYALDARVGDGGGGYGGGWGPPVMTSRDRLDAVARALPDSGLNRAARAQLQVEHDDLLHLEAAYTRSPPSADDAAYLDRRIADLETRVRR